MNQTPFDTQFGDSQADQHFAHMTHQPADQTSRQALLNDLLTMSQQVIERRTQTALAIDQNRRSEYQHQLLQAESQVGAKIFGLLRSDQGRSFFCLDAKTWIWYESWFNKTDRQIVKQTIRYEISNNGVLKSGQGVTYAYIDGYELENFYNAVKVYLNLTGKEVYQQVDA